MLRRPLLFRGTTLAPVRAFTSSALSHPHANVLSADAFARGLVRSRTDYQVFSQGVPGKFYAHLFHVLRLKTKYPGEKDGMEGLDIAFYKDRAVYHTPLDSIPGMGTGEARRALWAMMETVRGVGLSLLNDNQPDDGQDPGVYFDGRSPNLYRWRFRLTLSSPQVLGRAIIVFRLQYLFISNIILLILGPIATLLMLAWAVTIKQEHSGMSACSVE